MPHTHLHVMALCTGPKNGRGVFAPRSRLRAQTHLFCPPPAPTTHATELRMCPRSRILCTSTSALVCTPWRWIRTPPREKILTPRRALRWPRRCREAKKAEWAEAVAARAASRKRSRAGADGSDPADEGMVFSAPKCAWHVCALRLFARPNSPLLPPASTHHSRHTAPPGLRPF